MSNLRLGYNMRIYRPGIWYLNPYLDDSESVLASARAIRSWTASTAMRFDLSYSNFTPKFNINLSARYSFTNNSIQTVTSLVSEDDIPDDSEGLKKPTGKDVLYSTYQNIGKTRNAQSERLRQLECHSTDTRIYMPTCAATTPSLEGSRGHAITTAGTSLPTVVHSRRCPTTGASVVNVFGQTPWIMLQGKGSSFFDYGCERQQVVPEQAPVISVGLCQQLLQEVYGPKLHHRRQRFYTGKQL